MTTLIKFNEHLFKKLSYISDRLNLMTILIQ